MQYRGYEIQLSDSVWIVRNPSGDIVAVRDTDTEASEYVDDVLDTYVEAESAKTYEDTIDWYAKFDSYCAHLPGKCYPTENRRKFGTTNYSALKSHIDNFEKSTGATVEYSMTIIENENYYIIDEVYKKN